MPAGLRSMLWSGCGARGAREQPIVFIEGWSNKNVEGSASQRRSLSSRANSVAPIESSPADIRGESLEITVPSSDLIASVRLVARTSVVIVKFRSCSMLPA